jgi:nicotinate dehydrogenase subunit A
VVNGQRRRVEADPKRSLLSVLRNELDLTGAKYGCGEGQCGACTILLNGTAARSCQIECGAVGEREIVTIEGLCKGDRLHPLQQSFIDCDALQCGYCTSGMILSGVALLHKNPDPSDAEIKEALHRNVCRCGAYNRIVAAVRRAAKQVSSASVPKQQARS